MHSCPKPTIVFKDLYRLCADNTRNALKENLKDKLPIIKSATEEYDANAASIKLHDLKPIESAILHPVTFDNLKHLYESKLAYKNGVARAEYDKILVGGKKKRCCFCSYEDPTELDHFLPKSIFPEFSILPINLVPSCHRCNKIKGDFTPNSYTDAYIHPYFENYDTIRWLEAEVDFDTSNSPVINYRVSNSLKTDHPLLAMRIERQFLALGLNGRYSTEAGEEISGIFYRLNKLKNDAGQDGVFEHLYAEAQSRNNSNINSWQSALYSSLYQSSRFCEMNWNI